MPNPNHRNQDDSLQVLVGKYSTLHNSPAVQKAVERAGKRAHNVLQTGNTGLNISKLKPTEKVGIYLERLHEIIDRPNDSRKVKLLGAIKKKMHDQFVIKRESIPESAYELEAAIAFDMGYGNIRITDNYRDRKSEEWINGQISSLDSWIDYLSSQDAFYSEPAKYWVLQSLLTLGKYNKSRENFDKRSRETVAPYPTLNIAALARVASVFDAVSRGSKSENYTNLSAEQYEGLVNKLDFGGLYAQAIISLPEYSNEGLENIRGEWKRYPQGSEPDDLYQSLQGYPLEWCTATYIETARQQLEVGDFYVYYSEDNSGKYTIPRVAIRMYEDEIAEVRGIESKQELDPYISPVVETKMKEFGHIGKSYQIKANNARRMTEIYKKAFRIDKVTKDHIWQNSELSEDDLIFILSLPTGFGYKKYDPRVDDILTYVSNIPTTVLVSLIEGGNWRGVLKYHDKFDQTILDTEEQSDTELDDTDSIKMMTDSMMRKHGVFGERTIYQNSISRKSKKWKYQEIARQLLKGRYGENIEAYIGNMKGISHQEVANILIVSGEFEGLISSLRNMKGINHQEIALKLIESGNIEQLASNLRNFRGLNQEIALKLIESGYVEALAYNLRNFRGLNQEIALKLMEQGWYVAQNMKSFEGLNYQEIALKLIESGNGGGVAEYLQQFEGINHQEIALKLIESGNIEQLASNLRNFRGLNQEIALKLIESGYIKELANNLWPFRGLNQEIALKLIESGNGVRVVQSFQQFEGINHQEIALKLIESGNTNSMIIYIDRFTGLNQEIALKLIEAGYSDDVVKHLRKFGLTHEQFEDLQAIKEESHA